MTAPFMRRDESLIAKADYCDLVRGSLLNLKDELRRIDNAVVKMLSHCQSLYFILEGQPDKATVERICQTLAYHITTGLQTFEFGH